MQPMLPLSMSQMNILSRNALIRIPSSARKDSIWNNILDGGRTKDYNHQMRATFAVPLKSIPIVDWVKMDLSYDAFYSWKAAALNVDSLGNVISNGQTAQISTELDFTKLYNKSAFLAKVNKSGSTTSSANRGGRTPANQPPNPSGDPANNPRNDRDRNAADKNAADKNAADKNDPGKNDPGKNDPDKNDPDKNAADKTAADKAKDDKKKPQEISPPLKVALRMVMAVRKFRD